MTGKIKNNLHSAKVRPRSALTGGILAGLTAPAIFFTSPSYGSQIHRSGLNTDFRNVGLYMRSAIGKYRLGQRNEKTKKT